MTDSIGFLAGCALFAVLVSNAMAGPTFVCKEPGGKRLVEVQDNDISPVGEKIAFRIDSEGFINDADGKHVFYVSDDDLRHQPGGVKVATFDGESIRHAAGGPVVLYYHEKDICPDSESNRIYSIEGPAHLSKPQLVAAMYLIKPELFKLTQEETAAQQKAIAEAAAEQDKIDRMDQLPGNWMVLNSSGIMEKLGQGSIVIGAKKGDANPIDFDFTKGDGPKWQGVGVSEPRVSDDQNFIVAYGTPKTIAICRYEIAGGTLKGKWMPWYVDGDPKNTGTEVLSGPAGLDGEYKIDSAAVATTGAAYTGTVTIKPMDVVGATDKPYDITWTIGGAQIKGIGMKTDKYFYAAMGVGATDVCIAKYVYHNGSMNSEWYKIGSTEHGTAAATKMN